MQTLFKILLLGLAVGIIWIFQPVEHRFPEPASNETLFSTININRATRLEFEALPGIGPKLAQAIIQFRDEHGPFTALDQLKEVKGIGEQRFALISGFVTLGEGQGESLEAH